MQNCQQDSRARQRSEGQDELLEGTSVCVQAGSAESLARKGCAVAGARQITPSNPLICGLMPPVIRLPSSCLSFMAAAHLHYHAVGQASRNFFEGDFHKFALQRERKMPSTCV